MEALDYLYNRPIQGIDALSMASWKSDCEAEWKTFEALLENPSPLTIYLNAYCDLAFKSSQIVQQSWTIQQRQASVDSLLRRPQVEQRTQDWYTEAQRMLTASQFATILQTGLTRGRLVMEKASGCLDTSQRRTVVESSQLNPFTWGIRFEPIVNQIYCHLTGTIVKDMGRLKHQVDPRLAASPDGMVVAGPNECLGRFVEFKAPVTRKLNGAVPKDYMTQMQIQMEVGNVEECDYLEVKFSSTYQGKVPELKAEKYFGEIYIVEAENETLRYMYSPLNTVGLTPILRPNERVLETVPWATSEFYCVTVPRSRSWFASVQPAINSFWKDVELAKQGLFVLPESSRKKKEKDPVCMIMDES
jgi:hypothetical protein